MLAECLYTTWNYPLVLIYGHARSAHRVANTELPTRGAVPRLPPWTEAALLHTLRGRLLKKDADDYVHCTSVPCFLVSDSTFGEGHVENHDRESRRFVVKLCSTVE